jgi:hypothetical protein
MTRAVLVAVLVLVSSSAHAQMSGAPMMPDVREMSGIPRPDPAVPAGVVTVRVVQGELARLAAKGTPVHLVGVTAGGKVTLVTRAVNDEGRAEFTGLARDGSVSYYALCILGEDRLESDVVVLPPEVGVRLMLAGRKLDRDGKPVGEPVDDAARRAPDGATATAAGTVEVVLRGRPTGRVRVRRLGEAGGIVGESAVDGAGTARLTGVASGGDRVYIAEAEADGRTFLSSPFMMDAAAGVTELLVAYGEPLFALQGGALLDDNGLEFEMQYVVVNATGRPVDLGDTGIVLPLPTGARSGSVSNDMGRKITFDPDRGVVWKGVLPPGQHDAVVHFFLPSENGAADFAMAAPYGVFSGSLFIESVPGLDVTSPSGKRPETRRGEDGREFLTLRDIAVKAGDILSFHVTGLPIEPTGPRLARLLVGALVALLLGVAVAAAVWPRKDETPLAGRDGLEKHRDRLYDQLVSLERRRVAGKIDPEDFDAQRKGLVAKLALVHRQLDELKADKSKSARTR